MNIREYLPTIELDHVRKINFYADGKQSIRVGRNETMGYREVPEEWYNSPALVATTEEGDWTQGTKLDSIELVTGISYRE